jgi:L-amino acid N-acyltransferase YncA
MGGIEIRPAAAADWTAIWPLVQSVAQAGETYAYPRDLEDAAARALWMVEPPTATFVAVEEGELLGIAKIGPNQMGPGAHVANGSFMVSPAARGRGVGRLMGQWALDWARAQGFRAMQFNAVVEANGVAVRLWQSLDFEIVGTVPEAFDHPTQGLVGLHIMHRRL